MSTPPRGGLTTGPLPTPFVRNTVLSLQQKYIAWCREGREQDDPALAPASHTSSQHGSHCELPSYLGWVSHGLRQMGLEQSQYQTGTGHLASTRWRSSTLW